MARIKRVSGKLRRALDLTVWGGLDGEPVAWDEAARAVGLRTRALRLALQKAHVRRYVRLQQRTMLAAVSAQNLRRAVEIRDQDENKMAAINAIKLIENGNVFGGDEAPIRTPGIVIQIVEGLQTGSR